MDSATLAAMTEALDDEYKARATYEAVIDRFGPVRPFTNIIRAEDRHAAALERLFQKYAQPIPADRWAGQVIAPATLQEAYAAGVEAEIENRALYDRIMTMTDKVDVLRVFDNLRRASQDNHLPAFQRALGTAQSSRMASSARMETGARMETRTRGAGKGRRGMASSVAAFTSGAQGACGRRGFGGRSGGHRGCGRRVGA